MLDKLCLHFFCSCLQFSVLTRFVCRICLHFGPVFGGLFADKVCLQDLSAFWPSFRRTFCRQSLSAGFVCILARFWRILCRQSLSAEFVWQDFMCRQSLSAEPLLTKFVCMPTSSSATSTRWQTLSTVDKLCLQYDKLCLQRFSVRIWPGPGGWGVLEGGATAVMPTYGFALGRYFGCMARFVCIAIVTRFVYTYDTYAKFVCIAILYVYADVHTHVYTCWYACLHRCLHTYLCTCPHTCRNEDGVSIANAVKANTNLTSLDLSGMCILGGQILRYILGSMREVILPMQIARSFWMPLGWRWPKCSRQIPYCNSWICWVSISFTVASCWQWSAVNW